MSNMYKYSLEIGSKKFICPNCGEKTFVKYVENETNNYLSEDLGRCDRETNCGYHKKPNNEIIINNHISKVEIKKPTSYHEEEDLHESYYFNTESSLVDFLKIKFENNYAEVMNAIEKFMIGHYTKTKDSTVFWQIDNNNNVRAGKIIIYNSSTGKRSKGLNDAVPINWMHKVKKIEDFNLEQCLFGLNQLPEIPIDKKIGIVESEKTAVILSIMYPDYYWMATGGKQNFKESMLKPIKDYQIVAYPDKGEFKDWFEKAKSLNNLGYKIEVNDWLETIDYDTGTDLADVILELNID